METINNFLHFEIFNYNEYRLKVVDLLVLLAIFLMTKLILVIINKALTRKHKINRLDDGSIFALYQLIKYIVWIIAIGLMLETVGIKLNLLLTGSAALLVGVGFGLQQIFNDVISGIILLFERSVKVGDILDIDGDVVIIKEIGLRTSKGLNRNSIIITLPNSLITNSKVINWSSQSKKTIFKINVGVAYGSDVDLVIKILKESALEHHEVLKKDLIEGRFIDFGNSSLDFQVLFYSKNVFRIERVKSDIRRIINRKFIENNILIPFPQMDVHLITNESRELNKVIK